TRAATVVANAAVRGRTTAHLDPVGAVPTPNVDFPISAPVVLPDHDWCSIGRDGNFRMAGGCIALADTTARGRADTHLLPRAAVPPPDVDLAKAIAFIVPGNVEFSRRPNCQ